VGFAIPAAAEIDAEPRIDLAPQVAAHRVLIKAPVRGEYGRAHRVEIRLRHRPFLP
jgi:hypothetical protein